MVRRFVVRRRVGYCRFDRPLRGVPTVRRVHRPTGDPDRRVGPTFLDYLNLRAGPGLANGRRSRCSVLRDSLGYARKLRRRASPAKRPLRPRSRRTFLRRGSMGRSRTAPPGRRPPTLDRPPDFERRPNPSPTIDPVAMDLRPIRRSRRRRPHPNYRPRVCHRNFLRDRIGPGRSTPGRSRRRPRTGRSHRSIVLPFPHCRPRRRIAAFRRTPRRTVGRLLHRRPNRRSCRRRLRTTRRNPTVRRRRVAGPDARDPRPATPVQRFATRSATIAPSAARRRGEG